jgi:predicted transcriptional regulator
MGKKRDRVSIIAAVLEATGTGTCKTNIMLKANLSFALLEKYLEVAIDAGLLHVDVYHYTLTPEGRVFLSHYHQFCQRNIEAQKLVDSLAVEKEKLAFIFEA